MHTVIDDQGTVHTLINTFFVKPDQQGAVVASLREFTVRHAQSLPGFVASAVHTSLDRRRVINYVQWRTEADLTAMLATPAAIQHMAEVGALATCVDPVVYEIACVFARGNAPA